MSKAPSGPPKFPIILRNVRRIASGAVTAMLAIVCLGESLQGGVVTSRGALQTLLGGPGTLENFEAFNVTPGFSVAVNLTSNVLDASTVANSQGPGLVVPGVSFTFGSGGAQWDGQGYYGAPSKEILSGSPAGQPLVIDFTTFVNAFGVDLRALSGYGATATMTMFGTNDTTVIGTLSNISLSGSGVPLFAGWEDLGGIGRVELTQTGQDWSPVIDNLEFGVVGGGAAVPEPSSFITFLGLAALGLIGTAKQRFNKPGSVF